MSGTYFIDAENAAEMARLLKQARQINKAMGDLLPGQSDLAALKNVLDVGCGPGGWIFEMAALCPDANIIGVDISQLMVEYANYHAESLGLFNTNFQAMDATGRLAFADSSFDVINSRLISGFMSRTAWPAYLRECLRVTRPGGTVYLTECEGGMSGITNSKVCEQLYHLGTHALHRAGHSFSPDGWNVGITPVLRRLLLDSGFEQVQIKAHVVDYSAGAEAHDDFFQNMVAFWKLLQPFLVRQGVATQDEVSRLYFEALEEMQSDTFCGCWYLLTAWGQKPA